MLTLLRTWQTGDVSLVRDGGDYEKCLKAIKARGLVMPSKTDLYFPVSRRCVPLVLETSLMQYGSLRTVILKCPF